MNKTVLICIIGLLVFPFRGNSQEAAFKVMTYNIRLDIASDGVNQWMNRSEPLIQQIQQLHPDVLGVQEALPHQVNALQKGLPDYLKIGVGREENFTGEASCLYIKETRFTVLDSGTFWLSPTPEKVSRGWDAACNRVCTYAQLMDQKTQRKVWFLNTHWDHVGEIARTESLKLTLTKIAQLNPNNDPVIYMGDFNTTPDHPRWQLLSSNWIDTWKTLHPNDTQGTFNGFQIHPTTTPYIDYIWATKNQFKVWHCDIIKEHPHNRLLSDHYPVVGVLELSP